MSALDAFIIANHNWLVWVIPLVLVGLVKAIIWNRSYKTYVIKGKHRNSKDITKVVYSTSELLNFFFIVILLNSVNTQ